MKMKVSVTILLLAAATAFATKGPAPTISGDYVEVRSCDVYTGPCFANAEMGLNVIAVVRADGTLGDLRYQPRRGMAVLVVDRMATPKQQAALIDLARSLAGGLIQEVAEVKAASMEVAIGACARKGCASVKAGKLVEINTRCLGAKDHLCGNEETFYPPLTDVDGACPAFAELASYAGSGLNLTWDWVEKRNAFTGSFAR